MNQNAHDINIVVSLKRNILIYKYISQSGWHIETINEKKIEYLYITIIIPGKYERLPDFSSICTTQV